MQLQLHPESEIKISNFHECLLPALTGDLARMNSNIKWLVGKDDNSEKAQFKWRGATFEVSDAGIDKVHIRRTSGFIKIQGDI